MRPYIWDDFFDTLSGCVSWLRPRARLTKLYCSSKRTSDYDWFPLDLGPTTVEQCPFLALSVRMTEAKKNLSKAKITSDPAHTSCTHLVIVSSLHTLQKQHHPAAITPQTSHRPPVKARPQWVKGETIKVKSSLIEWTPPKQLPSAPNLWTFLWKTHLVARVQVLSRVTT